MLDFQNVVASGAPVRRPYTLLVYSSPAVHRSKTPALHFGHFIPLNFKISSLRAIMGIEKNNIVRAET